MIGKMRSFFTNILSRESLSSKGVDSLGKHGSFLSELLQAEKLPEFTIRQKSGGGFLSNLLAFEKLPSLHIQQKNPSGIKPQ
jgi:hypothetical protein